MRLENKKKIEKREKAVLEEGKREKKKREKCKTVNLMVRQELLDDRRGCLA